MPSEVEQSALRDILRQIELAERFAKGRDFQSFQNDELHLYAVTRCLEIISEATRRLSDELKGRHPNIPWRNIAGAGNIYRHDYQDVAARRIWDTVQSALPPLRKAVEQELSSDGC